MKKKELEKELEIYKKAYQISSWSLAELSYPEIMSLPAYKEFNNWYEEVYNGGLEQAKENINE